MKEKDATSPPPRDVIIVAMGADGLIGAGGTLPWRLPEELALFRRLTMGHALIMGRATFAAIGRPLPGRTILVVSGTLSPSPGIVVCATLDEARRRAAFLPPPYFYAGGVEIYRAALPVAEGLWVSWIAGEQRGDRYFPPYDRDDWREETKTAYAGFCHVRYRRRGMPQGAP